MTHRGLATALAFVPGHEAAELSAGMDWAVLAHSSVTLVSYIGVGRLAELRDELIRHGRSPSTPPAVTHWGSRPEQQVVTGTLPRCPSGLWAWRSPH